MKTLPRLSLISMIMMIILIFCLPAFSDVLIVANTSVTESSLPAKDVQMIFLGKIKKWEDGKKIRIAALKSGDVHETFLSTYVDKSSDKFASFWKIATVSGTGYPPKYFETEKELVKYVSEKEGSIGYISSDTPHGSVKVLTIQ